MLTYQDCLGLCELTEAEIDAIAEHEHIPRIVAAEFGNYLIESPDGVPAIKAIILDDIAHAKEHGNVAHALALKLVLKKFIEAHPHLDV